MACWLKRLRLFTECVIIVPVRGAIDQYNQIHFARTIDLLFHSIEDELK